MAVDSKLGCLCQSYDIYVNSKCCHQYGNCRCASTVTYIAPLAWLRNRNQNSHLTKAPSFDYKFILLIFGCLCCMFVLECNKCILFPFPFSNNFLAISRVIRNRITCVGFGLGPGI